MVDIRLTEEKKNKRCETSVAEYDFCIQQGNVVNYQPKQPWKNTPATSGCLPAGKPVFQTFQRLTAVKGLLIWRMSMGKGRNFIH